MELANLFVPRVTHADLCWLLEVLRKYPETSGGESHRLVSWVGDLAAHTRKTTKGDIGAGEALSAAGIAG